MSRVFMERNKKIGERLKQERKRLGLSQGMAGKSVGDSFVLNRIHQEIIEVL